MTNFICKSSEIQWAWFQGSQVSSQLLKNLGVFRSHVLYDLGFRKSFGPLEPDFGDLKYVDFESYHILAIYNGFIIGSVRVTPPQQETVALSVLGKEKYLSMLQKIDARLDNVIEINRLMVDLRFRELALGRTLMYAAVALIENLWNRENVVVIGSAGNCTKQTEFFLKHTDYVRIPDQKDQEAPLFNDAISFLIYQRPPYQKGVEWISFFKSELQKSKITEGVYFSSYYQFENKSKENVRPKHASNGPTLTAGTAI